MAKPIRYTSQKQQERKSWHQFRERLEEFGWIASRPSEDLGEDFIVHIYFQGKATGVTFHVQLKSITNLNERRNGDYLVFDEIKVKDLKHWEDFRFPVVLVVWDVKLREGRWALVDNVIADLDQRRPKWRKNKSKVRVHIPWEQKVDDVGLIRLKQDIGRYVYPLIAKDKSLNLQVKLRYPHTEEGQTAYLAFDRFIKEGEEVTIEGKFISEIISSDWWGQWFGEYDNDKATLTIGKLPQTHSARIDIIGNDGTTSSIPTIELSGKGGMEVIRMSNDHQHSPVHIDITINKYLGGTLRIERNILGHNVCQAYDAIHFWRAITVGGLMKLTFFNDKVTTLTMRVVPQPSKSPSMEEIRLVESLCIIQNKTGHFLQMPAKGLTNKDVESIDRLINIVERGKITRQVQEIIPAEFKGEVIELFLEAGRQNQPIHLRFSETETSVQLFDQEISTGCMTKYFIGIPKISAQLEECATNLTPDKYLPIKLMDVEIVEIFPDWFIREAQRLNHLLLDNFGAKAVYLFGSLVWSEAHAPQTDIDLAIKGLASEKYLEAIGFVERESKFPIDLVEFEKLPNHLQQRILTEGKLLGE